MQEAVEDSETDGSSSEDQGDQMVPAEESAEAAPADDNWVYEPGRKAAIGVAGKAEEYDQQFFLLIEVTPSQDSAQLSDVDGLADENGALTDRIDLSEPPYDVQSQLIKTTSRASASQLKDSNNFVSKCEQSLNQQDILSSLGDALYEGDLEAVESLLFSILNDEVFPGSDIDVTIKIGSNLEENSSSEVASAPREAAEAEQGEEQDQPMFLNVMPEVNPSSGVPLRELSSGKEIQIRVVGDSVTELRPQFRASEDENGSRRESKPLFSKLLQVDDTSQDTEADFVVKITNEVYGKGSVDPNTMVQLRNEEDIPSHIILRRKIMNGLVGLLIAIFSASILILLFPDSFLSLLALLQ